MPPMFRTLTVASTTLALVALSALPLGAQTFFQGIGIAGSANAESNFLLAAQNEVTESFDARTTGQLAVSFPIFGGATATLQNGEGVTVGSPYGGTVVSGTKGYTAYPDGGVGGDPQFLFSSPVSALGMYLVDIELAGVLRLNLVGGGTLTRSLLVASSGNRQYLGVVFASNAIASATLDINSGEGVTIDDLSVGAIAAVPEPGTWALLATGLAGLGALARRRRSA